MGKKKTRKALDPNKLLNRQIILFIVLTLVISWPFMIVSALGQLSAKTQTFVMMAPFLSALITTGITRKHLPKGADEHQKSSGVRWGFNILSNVRMYLFAWLAPIGFMVLGAALYFLLIPQSFSFDIVSVFANHLKLSLPLYVLRQFGLMATLSVLLMAVPAMGEEAGWRGYLMPRLMVKFGLIKSLIITALVWGIWQWPILAIQWRSVDKLIELAGGSVAQTVSGYLYGTDYFGAPWTGMVAVCIYSFALGTILWWIYCKTQSVWAASLAHGSAAALGMFALDFRNYQVVQNWLLGPSLPGLIAVVPLLLFAFYLIFYRKEEMELASHMDA